MGKTAYLGFALAILLSGCGTQFGGSTQSSADFKNDFVNAFPDNALRADTKRAPKGDGTDIPLTAVPLGSRSVTGARGVTASDIFQASSLIWLQRLADWAFARIPSLTTVGRISFGSDYYFASQNASAIYDQYPNQRFCIDWVIQFRTNQPFAIVEGPSYNIQSYTELPDGTKQVRARTYGKYDEGQFYIAIVGPAGSKEFSYEASATVCGASDARHTGWQNLNDDVNRLGQMTYQTSRPEQTSMAVTVRFINRQIPGYPVYPTPVVPTPSPTPTTPPPTSCVPTKIIVAGIYESNANHQITGDATLTISSGDRVALVVSSYEATRWQVSTFNRSRVCSVLANGYDRQQVVGNVTNVETHSYDERNLLNVGYPYTQSDAAALIALARQRYGYSLPVVFGGGYRVGSFGF